MKKGGIKILNISNYQSEKSCFPYQVRISIMETQLERSFFLINGIFLNIPENILQNATEIKQHYRLLFSATYQDLSDIHCVYTLSLSMTSTPAQNCCLSAFLTIVYVLLLLSSLHLFSPRLPNPTPTQCLLSTHTPICSS